MNQVLPELLSKQPHFDWVQYPLPVLRRPSPRPGSSSRWMNTSRAIPSAKDYLDWLMPAYGEFYTKWNGKTYGVMLDGDIHVLHYRKSRFADPDLQKKYSARFQRDLLVPKTWQEFVDCTQFFTEELSSQGIYGTSMVVRSARRRLGRLDEHRRQQWRELLRRRNESDDQYAAVRSQALDMLKQIVKFGPPGKESQGVAQAMQRWQSGADVMSVWWMDLAKSTAQLQGPDLTDDQGADIIPGWKQADGTVSHRADLGCGAGRRRSRRTRRRPSRMRPSTSSTACPIRRCPTTSWRIRTAARSPTARRTTPTRPPSSISSRIRSATPDNELWPMNDGIFRTFATARDYLDGGLKNVQVGYPQFYWEGTPRLRRRPRPQYRQGGRRRAHLAAGPRRGRRGLDQDRAEARHRQAEGPVRELPR